MSEENQALDLAKEFVGAAGTQTVNKIADFFGMLFPYAGLKKQAVENYVDDVKNSNLSPDAKFLAISGAKQHLKAIKNQHSIANIALSAAAPGTDFSENSGVDEEWLSRFMDASKFVTDENAQLLWGNILAGEFEHPGSTPPSVIRILSELTTRYAQVFVNLCSLNILITPENTSGELVSEMAESQMFIPPNAAREYMHELDISFDTLSELEQLGLIKFSELGFRSDSFDPALFPRVQLSNTKDAFMYNNTGKEGMLVGNVLFTAAGRCIANFTTTSPVPEHLAATEKALNSNHFQLPA